MSKAEDSSSDEEELDDASELANSDSITKYKTAAEIATKVLGKVVAECTPGKKIVDICLLGDNMIEESIKGVFGKSKEKGIAFPTSISVNNCVGHFSPLLGDTTVLADGDVVKVDLGVHIDGFISVVAHTCVATSAPTTPLTGSKANVICAAHYAAECAHRLIKPGNKNTLVTETIAKVAKIFHCEPVEGVLSHQMKRFVIDGNKTIINKQTLEHRVDEFEFEQGQVYSVDIVMSTGEGKTKETETRTTIYKRSVDQNYLLKLQAARYVVNEINARFPTLPFTLRALDEKRAKLGITECLTHDLVDPYPVLYEKPGEFVAQYKYTVLILPSGTIRLNSHTLPYVTSEYKIEDPAINAILQTGTKRKKASKKKKKKATSEKKPATASTTAQPMDTN